MAGRGCARAGRLAAVSAPLHVHRWGPPGADRVVLAVHGLTGHGQRWTGLATGPLADLPVLAPDLRGHGRSPAEPPWTLEQHAADLLAVLDDAGAARAVVLAHSFGAAVSLRLAELAPRRVAALVLLDPAVGLDPAFALEAALDRFPPPLLADPAAALAELEEGWPEVAPAERDAEVARHLRRHDDGRWSWRVSDPAVVAAWSEMARPAPPRPRVRTEVVVADRVDPPFVRPALLAWDGERDGVPVTVHRWACDHVVPLSRPAETAALLRRVWDGT